MPPPPADQQASHRLRPYRVTMTGGRCLATFKYREHAVERARALIEQRKLRVAWVHHRDQDVYLPVGAPPAIGTGPTASPEMLTVTSPLL